MKKIFTLLTLLVCVCTGAWADDVIFSMTSITGPTDNVASGADATVTATFSPSGSSAIVHNGKSSAVSMYSNSDGIKLNGSGASYLHATFTTELAAGDIISCTSSSTNFKVAKNSTKPSSDVTFPYTIPSESPLIGSTDLYIWNNKFTALTITRPQPKAPVFAPTTGSSVAAGSKITVTSQYATSIKYKWTADDTTPTDGWSDYDADAKITVPAVADGTPYLHVQSVRSGVTGTTTGYAQYTITAPDTEAPTLSSTTPADAATNVAIAGNIVLTFNENVACTTNATLTPEGGDAINLTPTVDGTTVTYAYTGLTYSKAYTFNLAANSVEDVSGNKYASAISFGFTTTQETVATPTFTVYGNKVVKIACATAGATIYYGGSDVKTGTKTEYTGLFIPATSGTIYAYATKTGANDSELGSQAVTLPVVGDVTGNKLITLVPDGPALSDTNYDSNTFSKGGYTLVSTAALTNSDTMDKHPHMFKAAKGTFTITPPSDVTIQSVKIYGVSNYEDKTNNVQKETNAMTVTTSSNTLMQRNVIVGDAAVLSEIVMTVASPEEGTAVQFKIGGDGNQARFYVEVYGTTSAVSKTITPANDKSTYVTTHALDFSTVSPAGLKAYVATAAENGSVTLEEVTTVPAGTPLMLIGTASTTYTIPVAASASAPATNMFRAGDGTTEFDGSTYDYLLFTDGLFYQISSGSIAVGKAYLHCTSNPTAGSREALDIIIDPVITGIENVKNMKVGKEDNVYYDLQGRRVLYPTKGLYIVNGKKVILK